jgi:hypothetical protein
MNSNEVTILTEAILELYLAIKIRSSDEVRQLLTYRFSLKISPMNSWRRRKTD